MKIQSYQTGQRRFAAFTIVELLVVLLVLGLIFALAVPSVEPLLKGSRITAGADKLAFDLSAARNHAISKNRPVEVRFLQFVDSTSPGAQNVYRAYTIGTYALDAAAEENSKGFKFVPIEGTLKLPQGIVFSSQEQLSSLLYNEKLAKSSHEYPVDGQTGATYTGFSFRPDGSTNLPKRAGDIWFTTLVLEREDQAAKERPSNFITISIDPHNGLVRRYQPL
jgi:uncharacterized protein (TIGR02596 family)